MDYSRFTGPNAWMLGLLTGAILFAALTGEVLIAGIIVIVWILWSLVGGVD